MAPRSKQAGSRWWTFLWTLALIPSVPLALYSYRYYFGVGSYNKDILANRFGHPFLYVHVGLAATALLLGPIGFSTRLRTFSPRIHRWNGRIYIVVSILAGIAGLVLAIGNVVGPIVALGSGLLAVVWTAANAQAWRLALLRRFVEHRAWMIRSWSLTFSAVPLRIGLRTLPHLGLSFNDGYRILSLVAWMVPLAIAELYIRSERRRSRRRAISRSRRAGAERIAAATA